MIKVGVIGCGYWGPNLIRNFVMCPETQLIWACDKNTKRMDKATRPYPGVKGTNEIKAIFADKNVDAVAIATPVNTHFPLAIAKACLESGKHVLVEKPLAVSVEEGEQLVQLANVKRFAINARSQFLLHWCRSRIAGTEGSGGNAAVH